ncbi:hypothetical protein B0H16DRAFT_85292 [Mycena metata]|uniref:RNase III domain-containing protein n=1 Tax=Mycena metata TaxID=1033252 RepID=A0AAD7K1W4_9AGAR|nr:hypothetical protein B0H16DRAFT_85292 [Mycena metata]
MAPQIHEIQEYIIASIHGRAYNPTEAPTKTPFSRLPPKQRERLEIWGDAILGEKLISFLFHNFTTREVNFISTMKAAMLSNLTFTNILLKAHGYSRPNGYPVDKTVADRFETMAALCYSELETDKFTEWFYDTFVPLINDAEAQWDRPDTNNWQGGPNLEDMDLDSAGNSPVSTDEGVQKKSWAESCIEAATAVESWPGSVLPKPPQQNENSRGQQLRPNKRWVEAMEVAGNEDRPPLRSNWVESMARAAESNAVAETNRKSAKEIPAKENYQPRPEPPPRRAHDIYRIHDIYIPSRHDSRPSQPGKAPGRPSRFPDSTSTTSTLALPPTSQASQIRNTPPTPPPSATPPSAIQRLESAFEREALEPLYEIEMPASASLALPSLDSTNTDMGYDDDDGPRTRAEASSPMEMSPHWSPTKVISPPPSPCTDLHSRVNLAIRDGASSPAPFLYECEPVAFQASVLVGRPRQRSDSISSTCSSLMDISVCDSPTKFLCFGQEPTLSPTKQGPPDILDLQAVRRGPTGDPKSDSVPSGDDVLRTHKHESGDVIIQASTFWPGQTVVFRYKQNKKGS